MKRSWDASHDPHSVGNLANRKTWLLHEPQSPSFPVLGMVRKLLDANFEIGTPAPATEMIVGAGLSVMLWCLIMLMICGVGTFVNSMVGV